MTVTKKVLSASRVCLAGGFFVWALAGAARGQSPDQARAPAGSSPSAGSVALAVGSAVTLECAAVSEGGGLLPDGSIAVLGQTVLGTMTGADFTIELGIVPCLAATCPASSLPQPDQFPDDLGNLRVSENNRYLSFSAGDPGRSQAIRIRFGGDPANPSLPPDYAAWQGLELWVQQPLTLGVNPISKIGDPLAPGEGFIHVAPLGCAPFFTDWTQIADSSGSSVIHVYSKGVVPGVAGGAAADYDVQVIDQTCDSSTQANFSAPLSLRSSVWADITGPFFAGQPTQGDGVVDTKDIIAAVDAFSGRANRPPKQKADLLRNGANPGLVDGGIDFVGEVTRVVDAAGGAGYPASFFASPPVCP